MLVVNGCPKPVAYTVQGGSRDTGSCKEPPALIRKQWAWIMSSASTFEMLRLILEIDLLVIFHSLWLLELSVLKLGEQL